MLSNYELCTGVENKTAKKFPALCTVSKKV